MVLKQLVVFADSDVSLRLETVADQTAISSNTVSPAPLRIRRSTFKRLVLPKHFQKMQIETFRLKLIKIAARVIRSSRYRSFRFCSSCPYKDEFREILLNIQQLQIPELAA